MTGLPEVSDATWGAIIATASVVLLLAAWARWMGEDRDDDDPVVEPLGRPRVPDAVTVLAWDRTTKVAVQCPTHGVIGYMTIPQAMQYECPRCIHERDQAAAANRAVDSLTPDLEALDRQLGDGAA